MKRLVVVMTLLASGVAFAEPTIAQMWTARGIQALEKLKAIRARAEAKKGPLSKKEDYEGLVEFSYAVHAAEPEMAQKNGTAFHMVLKSTTRELFDVNFLYAKGAVGNAKPIAISIDMLPKGWRVFTSSADPRSWVVMPEPGVLITLPMDDPFNISVSASK